VSNIRTVSITASGTSTATGTQTITYQGTGGVGFKADATSTATATTTTGTTSVVVDTSNLVPKTQVIAGHPLTNTNVAISAADVGAVPTSRNIQTINGLNGGGYLSGDLTLSPVYGSTANTVMQGNDSRVVGAVQQTRSISTVNGLQGGGDLSANRTLSPVYGSTANTVMQGNDRSWAQPAGSYADTTLSNVTRVNNNLVSAAAGDNEVGMPSVPWANGFFDAFTINNQVTLNGIIIGSAGGYLPKKVSHFGIGNYSATNSGWVSVAPGITYVQSNGSSAYDLEVEARFSVYTTSGTTCYAKITVDGAASYSLGQSNATGAGPGTVWVALSPEYQRHAVSAGSHTVELWLLASDPTYGCSTAGTNYGSVKVTEF
jgi:hypothetical protein